MRELYIRLLSIVVASEANSATISRGDLLFMVCWEQTGNEILINHSHILLRQTCPTKNNLLSIEIPTILLFHVLCVFLLGHLGILLSQRLVGAVGAGNFARNSFLQWAMSTTRTCTHDLSTLALALWPLSYPVIHYSNILHNVNILLLSNQTERFPVTSFTTST